MVEIFGAALVLFSSVGTGTKVAWKYRKRPQQIQQLEVQLSSLSSMIDFTATPLPETFEDLARRFPGETGQIFSQLSLILTGANESPIPLEEAFEKCKDNVENKLALREEDWEILKSLFFNLGKSHREDQVKLIELALYQLKDNKSKAKEERRKNEKLWRYLGILAGLLLVVLLW